MPFGPPPPGPPRVQPWLDRYVKTKTWTAPDPRRDLYRSEYGGEPPPDWTPEPPEGEPATLAQYRMLKTCNRLTSSVFYRLPWSDEVKPFPEVVYDPPPGPAEPHPFYDRSGDLIHDISRDGKGKQKGIRRMYRSKYGDDPPPGWTPAPVPGHPVTQEQLKWIHICNLGGPDCPKGHFRLLPYDDPQPFPTAVPDEPSPTSSLGHDFGSAYVADPQISHNSRLAGQPVTGRGRRSSLSACVPPNATSIRSRPVPHAPAPAVRPASRAGTTPLRPPTAGSIHPSVRPLGPASVSGRSAASGRTGYSVRSGVDPTGVDGIYGQPDAGFPGPAFAQDLRQPGAGSQYAPSQAGGGSRYAPSQAGGGSQYAPSQAGTFRAPSRASSRGPASAFGAGSVAGSVAGSAFGQGSASGRRSASAGTGRTRR